jgi:hypothetical protein
MVGLVERDMQGVINSYDLKPYYYPTLFPLKQNYTLTWKALEAQTGLKIAADLVARGVSIDKKTREALNRIQGDIPKIAIKRTMNDEELDDYDVMVAMTSQNPDLRALVEVWAKDTEYCWTGVAARLEWMALQQISLGKITLTKDNNVSVLSEYDVDYEIPAEQKLGYQTGSTSWDNVSAKPISKDFKNIVKAARAKGIHLKFAFMNVDTFAKFADTEEVQKKCASFAANALDLQDTPDLDTVNKAMKKLAYLYGLQIVVIDQDITLELADGSRPYSGNPFADDVVMFSETKQLGYTYWKTPADNKLQGTAAIKAMNGHTLIKKFANEEPVEEVTMGVANAFPAWLSSSRTYLLDTAHTSWSH